MQAELEAILSRFGADTGAIHLVEGGVLALQAQVGIPPHLLPAVASIPIGKGMAGLAVERNSPVTSCNIQGDRSGDVRPAARQTGVGGAVVVPVRNDHGNAVGALGIGVHRPHDYSEAEIEQLLEEASLLVRRVTVMSGAGG